MLLVKAAGVWLVASAFILVLMRAIAPSQFFWFTAGALTVAFGWLISSSLDAADGTALRRLGGDAERWVSDELRKLRRSGWIPIDHVPFADGDVDHFLVGPGGAWAIETKRSSTPVTVGPTSVSGLYGGDPCIQARRGARHMQGLLRPSGVDVRPAVVLAGPGAPAIPSEGVVVDGEHGKVLVLTLRGLSEQLGALSYTGLTIQEIEEAAGLVETFVGRRDQHQNRTNTDAKGHVRRRRDR